MSSMNKPFAKLIGVAAGKALADAMRDHDVTVGRSGGTYDSDAGTLRITYTFSVKGAETKSETDFRNHKFQHPNWNLGEVFNMNGTDYTIAGYRPRAKKHSYVIRRTSDEKLFNCSSAAIETCHGSPDNVATLSGERLLALKSLTNPFDIK